ncbi:MAG: PAS domain-containing protein [Alphaproteobacteria bacterium]|nr:PAS domain-containing protein [Alphaproteobacteria bacterium]MBU1278242.1 PAS domain-containing protein [Alphaproteobacteria bacterium]MBU1573317.1 PAS domain-containing protein [Alphaproteobacteria bacterium]MBU1828500.1 PAS domain-containing protein [Alphaproteobacteria bacterium]MBU2078769.1 PAS domain-containing protein [Alphaproteobacteria bacterium]
MSFQNSATAFSSNREEAPFSIDELFFSRTDERGVIAAGNEVFRRISEYSWQELVGAPHKIIRHPDMPKGVFYILWERLKKGLATGAYVKNRAKDGRYYWVYAVISPIEGGYVSVRMKPSSKVFSQAQVAYAEALKLEENEGLTPEESAAKIREVLRGLGFPTYAAFSSFAIAQEMAARDAALARVEDGRLRSMKELLPRLHDLESEQQKLFTAFAKIRGIPSNMRIVASRLEPAGGPISAISQNYRLMSDEVTNHLGGFRVENGAQSMTESVLSRVHHGIFMMAAARLQREVKMVALEAFLTAAEGDDFKHEVEVLTTLLDAYSIDSGAVLVSVFNDVTALTRSAKDLRQLVTGLDSIRVLCRVEAGRLGANSVSLMPVIDQLDKFHIEIDATLERIMHLSERVKTLVEAAMPRTTNGSLHYHYS